MRKLNRLRLLCFASATGSPQSCGFHIPVLPSFLARHVETGRAHHKKTCTQTNAINSMTTIVYDVLTIYLLMVDPGRIELPSTAPSN